MKKRLLSILLTLCLLLSLLPANALAAEPYELYINNFQFSSTKFPVPSHGFEFFTINDEEYMAFVNLRNNFMDGQFRIVPMAGATLEEKLNAEVNPYVYYLGDPNAEEDGTRVKNGNGLGSGDFRVVDGHNYYAAYVPGTGLSLFEIK